MIKHDGIDIPRIEYIDPVDGKVSILRVMQDGVQIWPVESGVPNTPTGIQLSEYEIIDALEIPTGITLREVMAIPTGITLTEILPIDWDYTQFEAGVNTNDTLVGMVVENGLLDMTSVPDESDFEVKINGTPVTPTGLTMSTTYIRLTVQQFAYGDILTVSYTPGSNPAKGQDGTLLSSLTDQALDNVLPEPSFTYLLDDYPGAAAAYSLRKLRTGETQAVRVRRDSDNAATDVYFYDDPNKSIDLLSGIEVGGTLGDWAGSDTVYVRKWYDQSGNNNDLLQTTNTIQPRIINGGVLDIKNGLSCLEFDGSDDRYELGSGLPAIAHGNAFSLFTVASNNSTEYNSAVLSSTSNLNDRFVVFRDSRIDTNRNVFITESGVNHNYDLSTPRADTNQVLQSFHTNGTLRSAFDNGSAGGTDSLISGTYPNDNFRLGVQRAASSYMDGQMQEVIVYESDQLTNRTAIETNINDFYNIYVVTAEVDAQLIQADIDGVSDTVLEINGVRSSASDTAVTNLISRNVTVITN